MSNLQDTLKFTKNKCGVVKRICIIRHAPFLEDPRARKQADALKNKGYDVDIICMRKLGEKAFESVNGFNIYRFPLMYQRRGLVDYLFEYLIAFTLYFFSLTFLHFRKRYDVIQVNNMPDFLVFTSIIPRLFGAKVVLDIADITPELFATKFSFNNGHLLAKVVGLTERLSTRYADFVLVASKCFLKVCTSRGLSPSKATVINNAPIESLFDYRKYPVKKKRNEFILIFHGSLLKRYGVQVLIRTIPYLKDHIPNVKLIILGEGVYLEVLENQVRELHVENYVRFQPWVYLEDVSSIISKADIGIIPLIKDEFINLTTPNKLFEYIAMKKPVIATRTEGIGTYFDDSCVMFFESEDETDLSRCILQLYRDPMKRKQLVENAWERYEKIRWDVTKETYCNLIEKLCLKRL